MSDPNTPATPATPESLIYSATPADPAATPAEGAAPVVEGTPPADATDGNADKAATGAPEKYEDFTMPEGVEVDKALVEQFIPIAKELNLTQEQAQKLVDLQAATSKAAEEARWSNWEALQKTWVDGAKSDKEYGGQAFDANMAVARKALDKWGTPELKAMMDSTGAGNHPEMLRFFYRVGKEMSEDKVVTGGNPAGEVRDTARLLFPNMN